MTSLALCSTFLDRGRPMDMDRLTVAKIALALAGVGIFAYGIRSEDSVVRWIGIGLVIAAFLLRFVRNARRKSRTSWGQDQRGQSRLNSNASLRRASRIQTTLTPLIRITPLSFARCPPAAPPNCSPPPARSTPSGPPSRTGPTPSTSAPSGSMRAMRALRLTLDELERACTLAASRGVRIYLTLNTLVKPDELGNALSLPRGSDRSRYRRGNRSGRWAHSPHPGRVPGVRDPRVNADDGARCERRGR